ncbi:MAG: hypothetical protein IPL53_10960 [Ignavibacteria bacterium]|nr:hypothetical protein [Ignavibacteria bacterium]
MNWKIILLLTLVGVAIAVASVFGVINSNYMTVYMIIFAVVAGIIISRTCENSLFMHGVVVGLLTGIFGSIVQAVMFNTYLENNPGSLDGFKNITGDLAPQYVLLFSGPFFGIGYGIIAGLVAFFLRKMSSKNK